MDGAYVYKYRIDEAYLFRLVNRYSNVVNPQIVFDKLNEEMSNPHSEYPFMKYTVEGVDLETNTGEPLNWDNLKVDVYVRPSVVEDGVPKMERFCNLLGSTYINTWLINMDLLVSEAVECNFDEFED